jgi:predicted transcriptional regulator
MKYRSSTEIIDLILRCASSGASKTRIMYKAYLSYSQLKEYLTFLQERDLLKYEDGTQLYRMTEKGLRFMNAYDEIRELVSHTEEAAPAERQARQSTSKTTTKSPELQNL